MPAMSALQSAFCRSALWRGVSGQVVLPWALHGFRPRGDVLEIGAGSGAMAAEVLDDHDDVTLTVSDFDPRMVAVAAQRLERFGSRVTVRRADATALPFADASFDAVLSWVMLHHTVEWEQVLAEVMRVLRPGGQLVGFDLLSTPALRMLHRNDADQIRFLTLPDLRAAVAALPSGAALLRPSLLGQTVRFRIGRAPAG
jgi:ubiquinone/menaquinone biosynthesis C-methylase UbiE